MVNMLKLQLWHSNECLQFYKRDCISVSKTHLNYCNFIGNTYKGNTFRNGITKIIFIVQTSDGVRYE